MTTDDYADPEAAAAWLSQQLSAAAAAQGWGSAAQSQMMLDIEASLEAADSAAWFGYDSGTFYSALATRARGWTWAGADKAVAIVQAAAATAGDVDAAAELGSLTTQLGGTAAGALEDAGRVGDAAVRAASSSTTWLILAAVAVGVVAYSVRR